MASGLSTGEEPPATPIVANAPPLLSTEAKMVVATGRAHCQQLKDMLSKQDPLTMVVVMASRNQTSTPPRPRSHAMDCRLLSLACSGSFQELESLLTGEASSHGNRGSPVMPRASDDEEAFLRESVLDGVTIGGDTLLHVVAGNGHGDDMVKKAGLIDSKAGDLLFVQNNNGDTPLHCAARAGQFQMVHLLIDLAKAHDSNGNDRVKALLETENKSSWTVLHEAVRAGSNAIVELLMEEDPELASFPRDGISPMYLAILMEGKTIAKTLYETSGGVLSYSGPNGQNALHAAVLRGKDLTKMLLGWNNTLTIQQDENGITPIHLVASARVQRQRKFQREQQSLHLLLLEANRDVLYQADNDGLFPTHVAASSGATLVLGDFLKKSPSCAGLRDARGRTLLHVAVEQIRIRTVRSACINQSLSWILNMQDNDGNTALHLAVQQGSLRIFCALFGNRNVHLSLTNEKGETPLDIARCNLKKRGLQYNQNSEAIIRLALKEAGAQCGICHQDYLEKKDMIQTRKDEIRQTEMVKEGTQNLCIGSVLIATVTFGATFAMPGGYTSDDHTNGGTPTLARRYAFDAFIMANALAFTLSGMATISLMFSGTPVLHHRSRMVHLRMAYYLMSISVKCLVSAFATGTYMMLAPVAHKTAVSVCVMSSLVLLYQNWEPIIKFGLLIAPFCLRKGVVFTFLRSVVFIVVCILVEYWPIIFIFCSTLRSYTAREVEPQAKPH